MMSAGESFAGRLAWVARTPGGALVCRRGARALGGRLYLHRSLLTPGEAEPGAGADAHPGTGSQAEMAPHSFEDTPSLLRALYGEGTAMIAVLASGIVVRALAPVLSDKRDEPAVVVLDEAARFAVPLLGGHRGANCLARDLSEALGAKAAITTASEVALGLALDAPPSGSGWTLRTPEALGRFVTALLGGAVLRRTGRARGADWLAPLAPYESDERKSGKEVVIHAADWPALVSGRETDRGGAQSQGIGLVYGLGRLSIGLGAARGCPPQELGQLVETTLAEAGVPMIALTAAASWEGKAQEAAISSFAARNGLCLCVFSAAVLRAQTDRISEPSAAAAAAVGAPSVAEASALAVLGAGARLLVEKRKSAHATCALAWKPVEAMEAAGSPHRVPYAPPPGVLRDAASGPDGGGRLAVIGLGPGGFAWLTPEARALLAGSEDWIGYAGYLEGLAPLAEGRADLRLHGFALGEERERTARALALARSGRRVALVSSGDPGIYAMASPVFEALADDPAPPEVLVSPGVSAVQAAAARLGAPIGHDFCVISLSDLLTPPETVLRRVEAAAASDFVVALYNPAGRRRRALLDEALGILRARHPADTPAAVARAVGHADERITRTTLSALDPSRVDMRCLVLVGSASTRLTRGGAFYTPRGYAEGAGTEPEAGGGGAAAQERARG